jgi:hypothetical protein
MTVSNKATFNPRGVNIPVQSGSFALTAGNGINIRPVAGGAVLSSPTSSAASATGAIVQIGVLKGANFNSTADQPINIVTPSGKKYLVTNMIVTNGSISLTTAQGGLYSAASKGGAAIVAASQAYTNVTGATGVEQATIATAGQTATFTNTKLYFSLTTAQGATATADIYLLGIPLG